MAIFNSPCALLVLGLADTRRQHRSVPTNRRNLAPFTFSLLHQHKLVVFRHVTVHESFESGLMHRRHLLFHEHIHKVRSTISSLTYPAEREASVKQGRSIHRCSFRGCWTLHSYTLLTDALKRGVRPRLAPIINHIVTITSAPSVPS